MKNLKKFIVTASLLSGALVLSGCGSDSTSTAYTTGSDGEATVPARAYENTTFQLRAPAFQVTGPAPRVIGVLGGTPVTDLSRDFTIVDGAGNPVIYNGPVRVSWMQNGRVLTETRIDETGATVERPLQETFDISNGTGTVPSRYRHIPIDTLGEMSLNLQLVDENDAPMGNVFTLTNVYAVPKNVAEVTFLEQPTPVDPAAPNAAKMKVALTGNYDANGDGTITTNPLFVTSSITEVFFEKETGPGVVTATIPTIPANGLSTIDFTDIATDTAGAHTFTVRYTIGTYSFDHYNSAPSAPVTLEAGGGGAPT